ncbi:hypothetical protein CDAR_206241 [Caerostris darwini]|uniref:Uncharacterized protein n=1 Tax=Caerostris darwini TaxID=1538125 RepID=A0AAV4PBA4_9ARAC|nr:hypothetical protein CDAR_206241 [Caerostris darwini]
MMTEGMDFCSADRQSPFQDPLTPLTSDRNGQEQLPDYMCGIIHQHEKVIENYQMELSYHLMYLRHTTVLSTPREKGSHRKSRHTAQQKIRHHEEQVRLLGSCPKINCNIHRSNNVKEIIASNSTTNTSRK